MLQCISFNTSSASSSSGAANQQVHPPSGQGNSSAGTPTSGVEPSPSPNREYLKNVHTSSFSEIMSKIHPNGEGHENEETRLQLLEQVLHPSRESIKEALRFARPNALTCLVSDYFDHSERTSHLCLTLHQCIRRTRTLYAPIDALLDVLDNDSLSLSQSQCNWAFNVFVEFDRFDNPLPCSDSDNFHEMHECFAKLKKQLDYNIGKSRSRIRLVRRVTVGSAFCLIGAVVGVAASAVGIAVHAFATLAAVPCIPACCPPEYTKRERAHVTQLDAAAKGTYVLNNDLDTIDRLVARLHTAVEGDKDLVRLGLARGKERYPIQEVVKQLRRNYSSVKNQLSDLEEHLGLCFNTVNKARSLLFQEICLHQSGNL